MRDDTERIRKQTMEKQHEHKVPQIRQKTTAIKLSKRQTIIRLSRTFEIYYKYLIFFNFLKLKLLKN